jgi:predicted amidohydrolase YtcJ
MLFDALASGITTIRNMDWAYAMPNDGDAIVKDRTDFVLRMRARAASGELLSPRIYTAGRWMNATQLSLIGPRWNIDPRDVSARISMYQHAGFDFVKPYYETKEIFDSVASAAKRAGLPLAGHVPPTIPVEQVLPMMKSIEHLTGYISAPPDSASIRALAVATQRAGVWNCPTQAHMIGHALGDANRRRQIVKALQDAGAGLLLGTDSPLGPEIHNELQALVASGLTPYEALSTGTRNVAMYFGTLDETGTIAVGKRADLVLLRGNPLEDVRNTISPDGVMIGGRWLSRTELNRRLAPANSAVAPPPLHARPAHRRPPGTPLPPSPSDRLPVAPPPR